jgi:hypothetical protein
MCVRKFLHENNDAHGLQALTRVACGLDVVAYVHM